MSTDRQTLDAYSANAARYVDVELSQTELNAMDGFLARLPEGAEILDLGCGPGLQVAEMVRRGFRATGWDPNAEFVAAARARGLAVEEHSFDDLTAAAAYDAIWASFSLLHAPLAELPRHLAAVAQALRPGGYFYVGMKTGTGERRDSLGRRYSYVTPDALERLVSEVGLVRLESVEDEGMGLEGKPEPFVLMTCRKPGTDDA